MIVTEKSDDTQDKVEISRRLELDTGKQGDPIKIRMALIESESRIYRSVIYILGIVIVLVIIVTGILLWRGIGAEETVAIPDGLIAIGSAAVGAIAGLLAQSPSSRE